MVNDDLSNYQWALPSAFDAPPDQLKCRLDFYRDTTLLYFLDNGVITTKVVSAHDVIMALLSEVSLKSGLLPEGALCWGQGKNGVEVALWRPPKVWPVALQTESLGEPKRFRIPLPGLIFVCSPARAPRVFAAKRRPKSAREVIYHAPLFNLFQDGRSCPGSHKYPGEVEDIPESFFASFFTPTAHIEGRSKKHPQSLYKLWEELDGQSRYPMSDLVPCGHVGDIMK